MRRSSLCWATVAAVLLAGSGISSASADPITYSEAAVASGTLDGVTFTDALLTIGFTGDTSNVDIGLPNLFFVNHAGPNAASVSVAGVGTALFTDNVFVFVNQSLTGVGVAGFGFSSSLTQGAILTTLSPVFLTYNLTSSIGPVTGPVFDAPDEILRTTAGDLAITSASQSTFTATVTATPVPEPGTLTLLGVGLMVSCRKAWQFSRRGQAAATIQS
jgi:PEP-CTERM motif